MKKSTVVTALEPSAEATRNLETFKARGGTQYRSREHRTHTVGGTRPGPPSGAHASGPSGDLCGEAGRPDGKLHELLKQQEDQSDSNKRETGHSVPANDDLYTGRQSEGDIVREMQ